MNVYVILVVNYITYGLRDQYVRLSKKKFSHGNDTCEVIALRVLEMFVVYNTGGEVESSLIDKLTLSRTKKESSGIK